MRRAGQPFQNTPVLAHVKDELGGDPDAWARRLVEKGPPLRAVRLLALLRKATC